MPEGGFYPWESWKVSIKSGAQERNFPRLGRQETFNVTRAYYKITSETLKQSVGAWVEGGL